MSGCKHLRQLLLADFLAQQLIWDATGLSPCPLTLKVDETAEFFGEGSPDALRDQAALAQQVVLCYYRGIGKYKQGMLGMFPQMKCLTLMRDPDSEPVWPDETDFRRGAKNLLTWCMTANQQPLLHLETIIITGYTLKETFPSVGQLPNLRELVIKMSGRLELAFQDPIDTISRLSSMHVFGRPFVPHGWDMLKLMAAAGALGMRGFVRGAAATEQHGPHGWPTSCMYLRPVGARELSIDELCAAVEQLAQCRCGACICCLKRAAVEDPGCQCGGTIRECLGPWANARHAPRTGYARL